MRLDKIGKLLSITAIVLIMTGCASTVTPAGKMVRQIPVSLVNECQFLGNDEAYSAMQIGHNNRQEVLRLTKNIVGAKGGNAYVLNDLSDDGMMHWTANFEIYKCK